jgi:hypothetical protein
MASILTKLWITTYKTNYIPEDGRDTLGFNDEGEFQRFY